MKYNKILILLIISIVLLTGCSEDTYELERNLYYDMEDINRYGSEFLDAMILAVGKREYNTQALIEPLDKMEAKLTNLTPPKHLKDEVVEWQDEIEEMIALFRLMSDGNLTVLDKINSDAIDFGRARIYDGFKEYGWKK